MSSKQDKQQAPVNTSRSLTGDRDLDHLIEKYLKYEQVEEHKREIEDFLRKNDIDKLKSLVGKRLKFGTAGLRGRMGPGFGQMNDLVIIQTSQGLASYLIEMNESQAREQGVIIGHDARHNSDRFARLAALAFLQKGIPVYFCDHIIPTPLIAFGVKHFSCAAGIVVTASHNPKQDNGYKVYWSNGAQILSPHDVNIQEHILRDSNQQPWAQAWDEGLLKLNGLCSGGSSIISNDGSSSLAAGSIGSSSTGSLPKDWDDLLRRVYADLSKSYFSYIESLVGDRRSSNKLANICITYTTMHGVGHVFLSKALDLAGFDDIFPVELQKKPDPNFSTVKFPNPEEAGALDLAFETAKHANSNLILANDPDADRCSAALYDPKNHYKRILDGNEIGALLGWWLWHCWQISFGLDNPAARKKDLGFNDSQASGVDKTNEKDGDEEEQNEEMQCKQGNDEVCVHRAADCYMISTAVSSKFLQSMARKEGFKFMETLTGFKYMGNIANELIRNHGKCVLFAYEEAIGYMVDSSVLDKDGISAAIQIAQCAAFLSLNYGRTLEQQLDYLYTRYGYHYSINSYFTCTDPVIINKIFTELQSRYPKSFQHPIETGASETLEASDYEFIVSRVRDLNNCYDSGTADKKPTLPCSSGSFMVTFFIESENITFTLRTSGTEPKIKYYSEIVAQLPELDMSAAVESNNFNGEPQQLAKLEAQRKLRALVSAAIERCLRPDVHNLEPAATNE